MKFDPSESTDFEAPRVTPLDLLADTGLGFSEPPPPGGSAAPGDGREGGHEKKNDEESDSFDWL